MGCDTDCIYVYNVMEQSQQVLLSVRDKIPKPNSLLPNHSFCSEHPKHLFSPIRDITGESSTNWPLDTFGVMEQTSVASVLNQYYNHHWDLNYLMNFRTDIVYYNVLGVKALPAEEHHLLPTFGSVHLKEGENQSRRYSLQKTHHVHNDCALHFDDCIESGNLYFALKHDSHTFLLGSRLDYNTRSYGQWFYFQVKNKSPTSGVFKFYIVNMTKSASMFGKGLKISVCRDGVWGKQGTDIGYLPNKFVRRKSSLNLKENSFNTQHHYYTLCFNLHIDAGETVLVSYNQPYTYSRLGKKLDSIKSQKMGRSVICRTPLGNRLEVLTITKKSSLKDKKVIFIVGRTHPVQTAGSFVVQGIINDLVQAKSPQIDNLLEHYIIKIVPMINPDGVIIGNSRCNLNGFDLNRQWKNPFLDQAPEIVHLKKYILKYDGRIQMFLDIHGHSKKKNVFAYGCHDFKQPFASREFPYLLSKFSKRDFLFSECRFTRAIEKKSCKQGTARISLWKKLKIPNIFTIENSYCCAKDSEIHYDFKSYGQIGSDIVNALTLYFSPKTIPRNCETNHIMRQRLLEELRKNPQNIEIGLGSQDSSESQSQDRINPEQEKIYLNKKLRKKKRQQKSLLRSKTQKVTKNRVENSNYNQGSIKAEKQINSSIKEFHYNKGKSTMPINSSKAENQLAHSRSNIEFQKKIKTNKNLSPISRRDQLQMTKCGGVEGENSLNHELTSITKKIESESSIKYRRPEAEHKNVLSVIQIGKETLGDSSSVQQYSNQYSLVQIQRNRQHVLHAREKRSRDFIEEEKKFTIFRKGEIPRKNDLPYQIIPVLKQKKMLRGHPSYIEELLRRLNQIQPPKQNSSDKK